jgi:hypothetical protein
VGDRYALTLSTETDTASRAGSERFHEDVALRYAATVEVLEVDATGMPVRERHEGVELRFERPDGTGSLFKEGATFEVVRKGDAGVALYLFGGRVESKIEKVVGDLLLHQTEYGVARLIDPGRPVAPGERWDLDAERVRTFLRHRGLHGADLDGTATARLSGGEGEPLRIHYEIPVASFALREMPAGARTTRARADLEGDVEFAAGPAYRPVSHSSALSARLNGELDSARPARFELSRSQSVDQRTETVRDQLASTH